MRREGSSAGLSDEGTECNSNRITECAEAANTCQRKRFKRRDLERPLPRAPKTTFLSTRSCTRQSWVLIVFSMCRMASFKASISSRLMCDVRTRRPVDIATTKLEPVINSAKRLETRPAVELWINSPVSSNSGFYPKRKSEVYHPASTLVLDSTRRGRVVSRLSRSA